MSPTPSANPGKLVDLAGDESDQHSAAVRGRVDGHVHQVRGDGAHRATCHVWGGRNGGQDGPGDSEPLHHQRLPPGEAPPRAGGGAAARAGDPGGEPLPPQLTGGSLDPHGEVILWDGILVSPGFEPRNVHG